MPDRVDAGDAEQVVHEAAGPGPPSGRADAEVAHQVGDVGDGEEVGREPEGFDHGEFSCQPVVDGCSRFGIARSHAGLAAVPQFTGSVGGADLQHVELGKVDLSEADVGARVEP